jgi:hypothetical protein
MPMELQIIRAQEFIRLGAKGRFDLKASKEALRTIALACWKRGINQALVDLRALHPGPKPLFTPQDLAALVKTFREIGFTHQQRLAVLYGSDPHHRARQFAFIASLKGWKVKAFGNFEDAVAWLSEADATLATPLNAREIPIRQAKTEKAVPVKFAAKAEPASRPKVVVKPAPRPVASPSRLSPP